METVEFRTNPDGHVLYQVDGREEKHLTKFSTEIIESLISIIENRFPECFSKLTEIYGSEKSHVNTSSLKMAERFIRCNFGENDLLTQDIVYNILNFEEVKCPLRGGFCPHENIICKPKSSVKLSKEETKAAVLYINGYTSSEIAERLNKHVSTIKVQLFRIKNKLGAKNSREIIKVLRLYNF